MLLMLLLLIPWPCRGMSVAAGWCSTQYDSVGSSVTLVAGGAVPLDRMKVCVVTARLRDRGREQRGRRVVRLPRHHVLNLRRRRRHSGHGRVARVVAAADSHRLPTRRKVSVVGYDVMAGVAEGSSKTQVRVVHDGSTLPRVQPTRWTRQKARESSGSRHAS